MSTLTEYEQYERAINLLVHSARVDPLLRASVQTVEKHVAALRDALGWFVENETSACRFDHHGACQEHSNADVGCCVADARKLLGLETA